MSDGEHRRCLRKFHDVSFGDCSQMEKLVQEMQQPKSGVPVRSQKTFLTFIPSVFTGKIEFTSPTSPHSSFITRSTFHLYSFIWRHVGDTSSAGYIFGK